VQPESRRVAFGRRPAIVERIVRRDRVVVGLCLAATVAMAWWWLVRSAGLAGEMPQGGIAMAGMTGREQVWSQAYLVPAFAMWAFMMVAMMLPSAAPMILLFARFSQKSASGTANTLVFALSYLIVWTLFSALAALSQAALVSIAAASADSLKLVDARLAGFLLLVAGIYQLSPLKTACLDQCRSPLAFLMQGWRPGWMGAARLGLRHGLYCMGCCWALMMLLFAAGVMNLAWIAAITLIVVCEKLTPPNVRARQIIAAGLLIGGGLMIFGV
jgi:predicted metal-binding membrane protein